MYEPSTTHPPLSRSPWLIGGGGGGKTTRRISASVPSPGAAAVGGDGAATPAVCCVPPGCACGPPAGPCAAAAAWPRLEDRLHPDPRGPRGFQRGPLAGRAAPLAARTPSVGSWERRGGGGEQICHTQKVKEVMGLYTVRRGSNRTTQN